MKGTSCGWWLSVLVVLGIGAYFGKAWWDRRTVAE
jgi:predicted negative regulator of RcsB-dependent stress response